MKKINMKKKKLTIREIARQCYKSESVIQNTGDNWTLLMEVKKQTWIRTARLAIRLAK
jgi:hypothetical protein